MEWETSPTSEETRAILCRRQPTLGGRQLPPKPVHIDSARPSETRSK